MLPRLLRYDLPQLVVAMEAEGSSTRYKDVHWINANEQAKLIQLLVSKQIDNSVLPSTNYIFALTPLIIIIIRTYIVIEIIVVFFNIKQ